MTSVIAAGLSLGVVGTADTGTTLVPATSDTPPPFNTSMIPAALATTFSSGCAAGGAFAGIPSSMGQIGAAMQDPMSAMSSSLTGALGANGVGGVCPSDQVSSMGGRPSCQLFYRGGVFDKSYYNVEMAQLNQVQAGIACHQARIQQALSQVQCLTAQESQLVTMIQQQQGMYQNIMQANQANVQMIVNYIADRTQEKTAVEQRLTGGVGGDPGLISAQQTLQSMVNEMSGGSPSQNQSQGSQSGQSGQANLGSGGIPAIQNMLQKVQYDTTALQTATAQRSIALTQSCFVKNTNIVSFQCQNTTGPPYVCSAQQYLVQQYSRGLGLDSNGYLDPNNTILQTQASTQGQSLQNLLNSIFSESASNANVYNSTAPDPATQTANGNQVTVIYTPAQINQNFGQALTSFNTSNFNVYNFVMSNIDKCYQNSQTVVSQEQTSQDSTSGLYLMNQNLITEERNLGNTMNLMLDQYSQGYSSALSALTGSNFPSDTYTSACKAASLQNRLPCLQTLQKNSIALLTGSSPNSQVTMFFQANNPALTLNIPCNGVNGCVTALQNVDRNLGVAISQLQQRQKNYVMQANQGVDRYTAALAASLGMASNALQQRLSTLNQTLMAAGLPRIDPPFIQGAQFSVDSNSGLYQIPTNLLQIVGGQLAPPLPDLNGASGGSGGGVLAQWSQQLPQIQQTEDQNASEVQRQKNELAQMLTNCKSQLQDQQWARASDLGNQIISNGCMSNADNCSDTAGAFNDILNNTLSGLQQNVDPTLQNDPASTISSVLNTGINQCQASTALQPYCQQMFADSSNSPEDNTAWLTPTQKLKFHVSDPNLKKTFAGQIAQAADRNKNSCTKYNNAGSGGGFGEQTAGNNPALCQQLTTNFQNAMSAIKRNISSASDGAVSD